MLKVSTARSEYPLGPGTTAMHDNHLRHLLAVPMSDATLETIGPSISIGPLWPSTLKPAHGASSTLPRPSWTNAGLCPDQYPQAVVAVIAVWQMQAAFLQVDMGAAIRPSPVSTYLE